MALLIANGDELRCNELALALAGQDAFTIALWVRRGAQVATVATLLSIADDVREPFAFLRVFVSGGVWFVDYDDGSGNAATSSFGSASSEWTFLSLAFEPGRDPSLWSIYVRTFEPASNAMTWTTNAVLSDQPRPATTSWAEHTLSVPIVDSQFVGHVVHLKAWLATLTEAELWREAQRGVPRVLDSLVTWNPIDAQVGGLYYLPRAGSLGVGYTFTNTPSEDQSHPPLTIAPPNRLGARVFELPPPGPGVVPGYEATVADTAPVVGVPGNALAVTVADGAPVVSVAQEPSAAVDVADVSAASDGGPSVVVD